MRTIEVYCANCAAPRMFEQPPCRDGHGGDCDEWVCVSCDGALLIDPFSVVRLDRRRRPRPARQAA